MKEVEEDADTQALRSTLRASGLPKDRQDILFNLGLFHKREAKPAQWAVFDSVGKDEDDFIDDLDALAGLEATAQMSAASFQIRSMKGGSLGIPTPPANALLERRALRPGPSGRRLRMRATSRSHRKKSSPFRPPRATCCRAPGRRRTAQPDPCASQT